MAQGLFLVRLSNNVHIMLNIWIILLLRFQIKYDTFILQNITFLDKFLIFSEKRISSKLVPIWILWIWISALKP